MKRIIALMRKKGTQEVMGLFLILLGFLWLGDNSNLFKRSQAAFGSQTTIHVEATCNRIWGKVNPDAHYAVNLWGADYKKSTQLAIPTIDTNDKGQFDITYNFPAGDFLFNGSSCNGRTCTNDSTWPMFSCAGSTPTTPETPVTPPPSSPPCVPNCNCAGITYTGQTCMDGCGGYCNGTATHPMTPPGTTTNPTCTPNCGDPANHCSSETWSNGCGGTCSGGTVNCNAPTTPATPTCTTATWKGGTVSSTNVIQGDQLTIKCDYGAMFADNIKAYLGDGMECTWAGVSGGNALGWNGTAAIFKCTASTKGVFQPKCSISAGGNLNICAASTNYVDKVDIAGTTGTTPTDDPNQPTIPTPTDVNIDPRIVRTTCGNVQGYAKAGTKIKLYLDGASTYLGTTTADANHIFSFDFTKYPLKHKVQAYEDCTAEGSTSLCRKEIYNKTTNANIFDCGDISMSENPKIKITKVEIVRAGQLGTAAQTLMCSGAYNMYAVYYQVSDDVKADWDSGKIFQMSLMSEYDDPRYWSDGTFRQIKTNDHGQSTGRTFGTFLLDYCPNQTSYDPISYKPRFYIAANYDPFKIMTGEIPNVVSSLFDTKSVKYDETGIDLQVSNLGSSSMLMFRTNSPKVKIYRSYTKDHADKTEIASGTEWREWQNPSVGWIRYDDYDYDKTNQTRFYQVEITPLVDYVEVKTSPWVSDTSGQGNAYTGTTGGGTGIGGQILDTEKVIAELSNVQGTNYTKDKTINNIGEMKDLVKALVSAGVIVIDSNQSATEKEETILKVAEALFGQGAGTVGAILERINSSGGIGGNIGLATGATIGSTYITGTASGTAQPAVTTPATPVPDTGQYSKKLNDIFKDINIFEEGITVADLIKKIINLAMALAGLVALAFIIYGGYMYIMSAGSPDESKKAMQAITQAAIGLVLVLAAWLIISAVINVFKS